MGKPFPGPWSFKHHPWILAPHDDESEEICVQKAAQLAWTEWALNRSFYNIDIKGNSVLYILPAANPDARDFSTSRFDPALELSPHLTLMFDDVKNIHHKRSGSANLFIRGSRVKSQLKSVPVSLIVLDELEEMVQKNIALVTERTSGQLEKQLLKLSTPTVARVGINLAYDASTQDHFFFKCPHCSKYTELVFPQCLVITAEHYADPKVQDSHLRCKECQHSLNHQTKVEWLATGKWVSSNTNRMVKGYHINQMYSMTVEPWKLATAYLKGLTNTVDEQEFFNSKLGLPHEVDGARIKDANIINCTGTYTETFSAGSGQLITMGVDVGSLLDVWIDRWHVDTRYPSIDINLISKPQTIFEGTVKNFCDLDPLMLDYNVCGAVVDANPEKRAALEFANRWYGKVKLCYYVTGMANSKQIREHEAETHGVSVDRTSWMDLALGRFHRQSIVLPRDLSQRAQQHLKTPVRVTKKDLSGNTVAKYVTGENDADHLAHARTYSEIALPLALKIGSAHNSQSPI
jgi:hypothetical protein